MGQTRRWDVVASVAVIFLCASVAYGFDENTPEFAENRKKMLDLLAQDECGEMNPWRQPRPDDNTYSYIWGPRKDMTKGDENCEEAFRLFTTLPEAEQYECAGAISPRCRRLVLGKRKHRWFCTVVFHDADRFIIPALMPMLSCTLESSEVYAEYEPNTKPMEKQPFEVLRPRFWMVKESRRTGRKTELGDFLSSTRKKIMQCILLRNIDELLSKRGQ